MIAQELDQRQASAVEMPMRIPDFFIVGAPKCGTTALYTYLREHPEVFMPDLKELNFFCADLVPSIVPDRQAYLSLFSPARREKRVGEASVWYLYSSEAAERIKHFNPESRIIIMLRHPVDMLYSLHSQRVFNGVESTASFEDALTRASSQHDRISRLLIASGPPAGPFNLNIGRYTEHVERYIDVFGRDNVKIILYDDLQEDTRAVYRDVVKYLSVDPDFIPSFDIVNANKQVRNVLLHRIVRTPSTPIRAIARTLVPRRLRPSVAQSIVGFNSKRAPRAALPTEIRQRLIAQLTADVEALGRLLERDLTPWLSD